jgi:hypothetical protein
VLKNVYASVLLAVVVLIGTIPPGHFTGAGQVIVLPAVASLVSSSVNETAPLVTPVVNVNVQLPVRVAVTKFPFARLIVAAVEVFPTTLIVSE